MRDSNMVQAKLLFGFIKAVEFELCSPRLNRAHCRFDGKHRKIDPFGQLLKTYG
jgi:hypothetical protein